MFRIIKKFKKLLNKHQQKRVWQLFAMMVFSAILEVLSVGLMLPLMATLMDENIIHTNKYAMWVCDLLHINDHKSFVLVCIAFMICIFIVKNGFLILKSYFQNRFIYNNNFFVQSRILKSYMKKPYEDFLYTNSGEVIRIVVEDVNSTFSLLTTLLNFWSELVISVALVITIMVIDPLITITVVGVVGVFLLFITICIKPVMKKEGDAYRARTAELNGWLLQAINGIKDIKISRTEYFFQENFDKVGSQRIKAQQKHFLWDEIPRYIIELMSMIAVLLVFAVLVMKGENITNLIPTLSALAVAAVRLLPAANRVAHSANAITYCESAVDNLLSAIESISNRYHEADDEVNSQIQVELKNHILLSGITYAYPNTKGKIFKNASMEIPVGSMVGIVGASGAGKTTAIDILLGLLKPLEGSVLADGVNIRDNYESWLTHVGYIPQTIFMMNGSIRDNVVFGRFKDSENNDNKVWKALKEAQLDEFVRLLPEGLDTQIGERGIRISGGQRQRLGIARALYTDPELLVFDEATSALDNETEAAIMESINSLHGKKTMVIIAHRLTTIEHCDIIYRVENGRIIRER